MQIRESNCLNCNAFEETDDGPYCEYKDEFITVDQVNGGCCDEWEPNDEELQSVLEQENASLRAKLAAADYLAELLGDVLTDCQLTQGMRTEIERKLHEWRGGK